MVILGISEGPGASAAVVVDGELRALVNQSAIDRRSRSSAFPSGAMDSALDCVGLRARDVDRVVVGGAPPPLTAWGLEADPVGPSPTPSPTLGGRARSLLEAAGARPKVRVAVAAALRATGLHMVSLDLVRRRVEPRLRQMGFERAEVSVVEEDRCQTWAAYLTQPRDHVLVLVLDEAIDGGAIATSLGRLGQVDRFSLQTNFAPICGLLSRVTGGDAGLADGVDPRAADPTLVAGLTRLVGFEGSSFRTSAPRRRPDAVDRLLAAAPEAARIASAVVAHDEAVIAYARHAIQRTGARHLALAGTLFRRPGLVRRLLVEVGAESIHVAPDPGAGAAAVGAALGSAGSAPRALGGIPSGPGWTEHDCYRALSNASLPREKGGSVADDLAAGAPVAWYQGTHPAGDDPSCARAVLRLPQHGAAPAALVARDLARRLFPGLLDGSLTGAPTSVFPAEGLRARCPAVVRGDNSVRVFLADEVLEPILTEVYRRTGLPVLAASPLGSPAACSPADAIQAWRALEGATLHLGPYRVGG